MNDYHKQLARKLTNQKTGSKTYWSILEKFCNGKKVPLIPPLAINDKLEPDFKRKADHFNNFFASKCTPLKNGSVLPALLEHESEFRFSKPILLMTKYWKFFGLLILIRLIDMMRYQSECWNYVKNLSLHSYQYCFRIVLIQGVSETLGKSQILCLFIKKGTSR